MLIGCLLALLCRNPSIEPNFVAKHFALSSGRTHHDATMTEIFLIRHGETEWNSSGRFQGKLNSLLTHKGMAQAKVCGQKLSQIGIEIDAFIVGPLGRTRQTASIIASFGRFPMTEFENAWQRFL